MSSFAAVRKQARQAPRPVQGMHAGIAGRKLALSPAKQTLHCTGWKNAGRTAVMLLPSDMQLDAHDHYNYCWLRAERDVAPRLSAILKKNTLILYIYVQPINGSLTIGLTFEQHSCAHAGQFAAASGSQRGGRLPQP